MVTASGGQVPSYVAGGVVSDVIVSFEFVSEG